MPPLSDLVEDSKEEQELVILRLLLQPTDAPLPVISHLGTSQGSFPSSLAMEVPLGPSFQASLLVPL